MKVFENRGATAVQSATPKTSYKRMYQIISHKILFKFRVFHRYFMKNNSICPINKSSKEGFKPSFDVNKGLFDGN